MREWSGIPKHKQKKFCPPSKGRDNFLYSQKKTYVWRLKQQSVEAQRPGCLVKPFITFCTSVVGRSFLLTQSVTNYQLCGSCPVVAEGKSNQALKEGLLNRCRGSRKQGEGPRDLLGNLSALGREERGRFQVWGLFYLL